MDHTERGSDNYSTFMLEITEVQGNLHQEHKFWVAAPCNTHTPVPPQGLHITITVKLLLS